MSTKLVTGYVVQPEFLGKLEFLLKYIDEADTSVSVENIKFVAGLVAESYKANNAEFVYKAESHI